MVDADTWVFSDGTVGHNPEPTSSEGSTEGVAARGAPSEKTLSPTLWRGAEPSGWPRRHLFSLRQALGALMRRINYASGIYQMFGTMTDVLVLAPLSEHDVAGYTDVGVLAATHDPASFYDPYADTSIVPQARPSRATLAAMEAGNSSRLASDAAISNAVAGGYFEEVPAALVPKRANLWAQQVAAVIHQVRDAARAAAGAGAATERAEEAASQLQTHPVPSPYLEWITLTLEFDNADRAAEAAAAAAAAAAEPQQQQERPSEEEIEAAEHAAYARKVSWSRDPFSLLRANATLKRPEDSHFLHPVLRYYHTGISSERPALYAHIIEDFSTNWYVVCLCPALLPSQRLVGNRASVVRLCGKSQICHRTTTACRLQSSRL